jgi:uncharacterized membrane protein
MAQHAHPQSPRLPREPNPALVERAEQRARSVENRIADRITEFAGSMRFVYIHVLWFSCWIGLGFESYPYGLLTMIVSLEAIFLSTFVMISQNRADSKREAIADQQWQTVKAEHRQNEELLDLSRQIFDLVAAESGPDSRTPRTDTPSASPAEGSAAVARPAVAAAWQRPPAESSST